MNLNKELIYLTKYVPRTKFNELHNLKPYFVDPILDLGCWIGDTFYYMKLKGDIVGIDIHAKYFLKCIERKIYRLLVESDVLHLPKYFSYFGCITAFSILEHLKKKDGFILLDKMKALGKNNIIIVPLGSFPQESPDENPYQKHISTWFPEDFVSEGFKVKICYNLSVKQFPFYKIILGVRVNE